MKLSPIVFAPMLAAMSFVPAAADQTELLVIGNTSNNDSHFYMLSVRQSLSGDITEGLRLRFDASNAIYATDYDATPGTGTVMTGRGLLSYVASVSNSTDITMTGGVSYGARAVTPDTLSSPDDSSNLGAFASLEFYNYTTGGNDFHAMVEYDSSFDTLYASSTYEFNFGSFKAGPTANYLVEDVYSRTAAGLSASFDMSENVEIKATAAWAEEQIDAAPATDASYFELQVRTTF